MNETELWNSFKSGNQESFTTLYKMHVKVMFRYGMSLVPASEDFVLDCIHDVFTELWDKRERVSTPTSVKFYLIKSLKNRVLHLLKRKEKSSVPFSEEDLEQLWYDEDEVYIQEGIHDTNPASLMEHTLQKLSHRQQEALRLRYIEELDFEQVADIMNVNRQSAQNLVQRALERLRKLMSIVGSILLIFWIKG